jgi:hypothetical protein
MVIRTFSIRLLYVLLAIATTTPGPVDAFLYRDFLGGNNSIIFARLRCFIAFQRTGFRMGDFASYPKSLRDDSIMELAQAGSYQGAANIEEYVRFAQAGMSPFVACCNDYVKSRINFVGYENGQCEFVIALNRNFLLVPDTTDAPVETNQFLAGLKFYLAFEERYIKRINVFFTDDFLRIYFDVFLNSANTRQYVCGIINGVCASTLDIPENVSNLTCEEQLQTLPSTEGQYYFDGKSSGCRALHAVFAATNPLNHCAHLSFAPLADPHGNIKCQSSKGKLPSSLFTESELQMFQDFAVSVGIDPVIGHTYVG